MVYTIRSVADEIGIQYARVWRVLRNGYVEGVRPPTRTKMYLTRDEVSRIRRYFGVDARS